MQNKVFIDPNTNLNEQQRQLTLQKISSKNLLTKSNEDFNMENIKIKVDGKWQNQTPKKYKRKLEQFEQLKKIQQVQQISYSNQNIDDIVRDAIKASGNENPVIVINHQSELTLPEEQEQNDNPVDLAQNMNTVGLSDISNLEQILDKIQSMYDDFYLQMPHQQESQDSNTEDKKLQTFMLTLQKFTSKVIMNSEELMNNINYFERKIHLIQQGEEHMMMFYNFQKRYAKLKTQTSIKSTDKIQEIWHEINVLSSHYDLEVSKSLKNAYSLYKFNYQFAQHIKQIDQSTNKQYTEAIQKFDQVLRLSVTLLEQKQQIEEAVTNIKKSLQQIKIISYHVDSNMMQIQGILDGVNYNIADLPEVENYFNGKQAEDEEKKEIIKKQEENQTTNSNSENKNAKTENQQAEQKNEVVSKISILLIFMLIFQLFQFTLIMSVVKKYLKEAMALIKKKDFQSAVNKLEILLMKDCKLKSFELPGTSVEFEVHDRIKKI